MGIPIIAFHSKYVDSFGAIAYIKPPIGINRKNFISLSWTYKSLNIYIEEIFRILGRFSKVRLLGCSAGSHIPLVFKKKI